MAPGKGDRLWLWPLLSAALLGGAWILPNSRALRATACEVRLCSGWSATCLPAFLVHASPASVLCEARYLQNFAWF